MRKAWRMVRSYGVVLVAVSWTLAPARCERIIAFPRDAVVGGRTLDELVADSHTISVWPAAPGLHQPGAAHVAEPLSGRMSHQVIPADTGIFVRLFASGDWDSPQECLDGDEDWKPLPDAIVRMDTRLEDHDERMWLNDVPIEFDWANARVDIEYNVLVPPGTTGPCIEPSGDSPIERKAAISGFVAYIHPPDAGEYVLEYFSPGFGLYTRTFLVEDGLIGDLNRSGTLDAADIDMISSSIREGSVDLVLDRDRNGIVNADDRNAWFAASGTLRGDADLSGTVDFSDFIALSVAYGSEAGWADGDFDGDGVVGFPDFILLSENFGTRTPLAAVPEPAGIWLVLLSTLGLAVVRQRRRQSNWT